MTYDEQENLQMEDLANAVEKNRKLILDAEKYIWEHPQTGFREFDTSQYLAQQFEKLGYEIVRAQDIPGFYCVIDTGRSGPEVLVLGELDCLICPKHKDADKNTGYVHACGHNVQAATVLGIAGALKEPGICDKLSGRIRLCLVPAEELIELDYRAELKKQKKIKYFTGKSEFLYRGYFDGVDMAFMVHVAEHFSVGGGAVGCIAKTINYKGVSSHAGGAPWNGKNALYGANLGLGAVNAIRETFEEKDLVRFHPIITRGGEAVNSIPELVTIESYVRAVSFDAMIKANKKINQALCGAALSIDNNIEITDTPGYAPLINDKNMMQLACDAAQKAIPEEDFILTDAITSASTDMGELCALMPVVHPYSRGSKGNPHGDDYYIEDKESACIKSAKWQLVMLFMLLENDAKRANEILSQFKPAFKSKEEYFEYIDKINSCGERIVYSDDSAAMVRI